MQVERKHRMTRQRQVILEELRRVKSHPTADELYFIVRQKLPRISLATVYRNLDLLYQEGKVIKLPAVDGVMRFDGTVTPHYHIRCTKCGRVSDVMLDVELNLERKVARRTGYHVTGYVLEFEGVCPDCAPRTEH